MNKMNIRDDFNSRDGFADAWTRLDVDVGALSHQGRVRENNEDSYLVMKFGRSLENVLTNLEDGLLEHSYAMNGYGMFVADGMGGLAAGEVASRLALGTLVDLLVENGAIRLVSRSGKSTERQYPELSVLPHFVDAQEAILDGEICAFDEHGRPDFERLGTRIQSWGKDARSTCC